MTTPFHGMRCTHCQKALAEPDSCLCPSCTLKAQLRVRAEATASDPAQAQLGKEITTAAKVVGVRS